MLRSLILQLRRQNRKLNRSIWVTSLKKLRQRSPLQLHLGCGQEHWDGWINLDIDVDSAADFVLNFRDVKKLFGECTVDKVAMVHSISYLRLWEARELFGDLHAILKNGGQLVLEFPDIAKCAGMLISNEGSISEYLEAVRGIYAFGMDQIQRRESFTPYAFGWSAWHMKNELESVGFSTVNTRDPQTHGQIIWRDIRIEAFK